MSGLFHFLLMTTGILKILLILIGVALVVFVLIHLLPYLLGMLAIVGLFQIYRAVKGRRPGPPSRWS